MTAQPDDRTDASYEACSVSHGFVAGPGDAGIRLDVAVARHMGMGRRGAARLLTRTRVNGRPAVKAYRLAIHDRVTYAAGDSSRLPVAEERERSPAPSPAASHAHPQIVLATEAVIVVDKPAGLASVALAGSDTPSLARWIMAAHPECRGLGGPGECGLVHRLDTDTSGLIVAARTASAFTALRAAFRAHEVEKTYLAAVTGHLREATVVDLPIGRHPHSRRRARAVADERQRRRYDAQPARTEIEVIGVIPELDAPSPGAGANAAGTLIRARTRSGAPHQVRVHLATIGHPLIGDTIYGRADGLGHRLRAVAIRFPDPSTDRVVEAVADPLGDERFARAAPLLLDLP